MDTCTQSTFVWFAEGARPYSQGSRLQGPCLAPGADMPQRPGQLRPPATNALTGPLEAGGHTNHKTKQPLSKGIK